jgi:hypothetical protein
MSSEHPVENERAVDVELGVGGDPVCWAHLVCPECGAITTEGHRGGCELGQAAAAPPSSR